MNDTQPNADNAASESRDASSSTPSGEAKDKAGRDDIFDVLKLVVPLAVVALLATVFGRALGSSWAGLAVGMNRAVRLLELTGSVATQVFALSVTVVALGSVVSMTRSPASWPLRVGAIVAGGLSILLGMIAALMTLPRLYLGISAALVTVLALACAWDAKKAHFARPAAFMLGVSALASLCRLIAVFVTAYAASSSPARPSALLLSVARGAATASFAVEVILVFGAAVVVAQTSRKLSNPMTTAALVIAFLFTHQASRGHLDEAGPLAILLHRAGDRFLTLPEPFWPPSARMFLAFFALAMAVVMLLARRQVPALAGSMALLLLTRSGSDIPLGALSLAVASIGISLASRDQRGLWLAIEKEETRNAQREGKPWVKLPAAAMDREARERSAGIPVPGEAPVKATEAGEDEPEKRSNSPQSHDDKPEE